MKKPTGMSAERAVELLGIHLDQSALAAYLAKGRKWSSASDEEVSRAYVSSFRLQLTDASNAEYRAAVDDLACEFALRNKEPPYDMLSKEIDQIIAETVDLLETMDEAEKRRINQEVLNAAAIVESRKN